MTQEFEGRNEQDAINKAVEALQLERDEFDVEILDSVKWGLFRKGNVKIRVHIHEGLKTAEPSTPKTAVSNVITDFEQQVMTYLETILEKMGYLAEVNLAYRRDKKIGLNINSEHSAIIIGKKGKNLDALQLLVNVYAGMLDGSKRVVVDTENYRIRHEEQLIKLAYKTAEQVKKTRKSKLLEPMNPFERRLIHSALNDILDIDTKSEGDGLYKQVRISFRGSGKRGKTPHS